MSSDPSPAWGPLALSAARAGITAIELVTSGGDLHTEQKNASHNLVTAADKGAEAAIIREIRAARPDDAILAEETGAQAGTTGVRWLVDPLDGTANFVYGRRDFAVSVGVEIDHEITAGAVIRSDGQWAAADRDFFSAGPDLPAAGTAALARGLHHETVASDALIAVGLPYSLSSRRDVLRCLSVIIPGVRGVRIMGSAAADLLAVACGQADAFVGFGLAEWDTAAGQALVAPAGGVVTHIEMIGLDVLIAGPARVVHELSDLLRVAVAA